MNSNNDILLLLFFLLISTLMLTLFSIIIYYCYSDNSERQNLIEKINLKRRVYIKNEEV